MSSMALTMPKPGSSAYCLDGNVVIGRTTSFMIDGRVDPGQSGLSEQSSSPSFPLQIPCDYRWQKASGLVKPTFGPCRPLQNLEDIVGKCDMAGMADFRKIFEWYRRNYHCTAPPKEQGDALSWSSEYANFVFLACEFFIPREPFKCRSEDRPTLFQSQLSRDEAISWILSFVMGEVFNHKTVTSRMQSIGKWFEGKVAKKQGNPHLWNMLHQTYQQNGSNVLLGRRASSTRSRIRVGAPDVTKDHILHPFLAYLLCFHHYRDLTTALRQPYLDISQISCPGGFEVVWRGIEGDMADRAIQAADARRWKNSGDTAGQANRGSVMNAVSLSTVGTPKKRKARSTNDPLTPPPSKRRNLPSASQLRTGSNEELEDERDVSSWDWETSGSGDESDEGVSVTTTQIITPSLNRVTYASPHKRSHPPSMAGSVSSEYSTTSRREAILAAHAARKYHRVSPPSRTSSPEKVLDEGSALMDNHRQDYDTEAAYALLLLRFEAVDNSTQRLLLSAK
ncbi:hypothetical protein QFC20_003839 [Naganishia adeliensis]|uniref:Uncharacterized protein n=1 Tax=Naganishia adeliensis TaxID=92952 RepID=A0ACC2W7D4_9TREE|nr:hypothetical protein QFC20_003839 [Naganishia adeliensis]